MNELNDISSSFVNNTCCFSRLTFFFSCQGGDYDWSFAPQSEPFNSTFPRNGWDEAPSGMLARGTYKAKSQFIDDDKQVHLEFEYQFGELILKT